MENQENVNERNIGSVSIFRKALTVKDANIKNSNSLKNNINQLSIQLDSRVKKRNRLNSNQNPFPILKKINNNLQKKNHNSNGIDTLKKFEKIREISKNIHINNRTNKQSNSLNSPITWDFNDDINKGKLVTEMKFLFEQAKSESTHAILKKTMVDYSSGKLIGRILETQILSNSLKILEIQQDDMTVYKIGIVCLWNGWIDIKKNDTILFEDLFSSSCNENEIQWSLQWKKIVDDP